MADVVLLENSNVKILGNSYVGTVINTVSKDVGPLVVKSGSRSMEVRHGTDAGVSRVLMVKKTLRDQRWPEQADMFVGAWLRDDVGVGLCVRLQEEATGANAYSLMREAGGWWLKKGALDPGQGTLLQQVFPALSLVNNFRNLGLGVKTINGDVLLVVFETKHLWDFDAEALDLDTPNDAYDYSEVSNGGRYTDSSSPYLNSKGSGIVSIALTGESCFYFDRVIWTQLFKYREW